MGIICCCFERDDEDGDDEVDADGFSRERECVGQPVCCMGRTIRASSSRGGRVVVSNRKGRLEDFYDSAGDGLIGEGSFGKVRKVRNKQSLQIRALKEIPKFDEYGELQDIEGIRSELLLMAYTDHPNVARLFEVFQDDKALYLLMEYCSGGDLMARLTEGAEANWRAGRGYNALSESSVADILRQALSAVAHLHALTIVHGDIKPGNFCFLTSDKDSPLKLIDFGSAKFSSSETRRMVMGTPDYASPEILQAFLEQREHKGACIIESPADIWAIGVMMHLLLTGTMLRSVNRKILFFDAGGYARMQLELLESQAPYDFDSEEWQMVSTDAKNLLVELLRFKASERPTAIEARQNVWVKHSAPGTAQRQLDNKLALRLTTFARRSRLEQAVLGLVADRILGSTEMQPIRDVWQSLDADSDGFVSLQDFDAHVVRTHLEIPLGFREALVDLAGDSGRVELNQFLAATMEPQKMRERRFAQEVFSTLDLERSGTIHAEDLVALLGEDCGVGDAGLTEAEFYEILDQGARRFAPSMDTLSPCFPKKVPSDPCLSMPSENNRTRAWSSIPKTSAL